MAYGRRGGGRRASPYAEERREREKRREERILRDRARFDRLMRHFRKIKLSGEAASAAWGQKELRSFTLGESGVSPVRAIVRGDEHRQLYLQEPGTSGWTFYKLVPRYHTPRAGESDRDVSRARWRSKRDAGGRSK